mmetsp:Transcript_40117/g.65054  ORF Transcript_40117/g.65054 Transcript_40117/m.65054 type:complete len:105 (+) Transcript_40117:174-488(+)
METYVVTLHVNGKETKIPIDMETITVTEADVRDVIGAAKDEPMQIWAGFSRVMPVDGNFTFKAKASYRVTSENRTSTPMPSQTPTPNPSAPSTPALPLHFSHSI